MRTSFPLVGGETQKDSTRKCCLSTLLHVWTRCPEASRVFHFDPRTGPPRRGKFGLPQDRQAPGGGPHGFVVRCICHAPPARGVFQAAVGSGCHSSTAPPPPWRRLACAAGLPRKSVGGREQVSLSPALSSRPACHSRVKGSR